ncbi:hypothetical protein TNCV_725841 [Trichonephila clavipes]|nr:hypothetical protein TNCV_725841 [Trichonephila clavipes]
MPVVAIQRILKIEPKLYTARFLVESKYKMTKELYLYDQETRRVYKKNMVNDNECMLIHDGAPAHFSAPVYDGWMWHTSTPGTDMWARFHGRYDHQISHS